MRASFLSALAAAAAVGAVMLATTPAAAQMTGTYPAQVAACFSPAGNCAARIVNALAGARREVRMQAMLFSERDIQDAVIAAKRRGVDVQIIVDPRQERRGNKICEGRKLAKAPASKLDLAGVPVFVDNPEKTAHNKLIIIDRSLVIGGSFNYTYSADRHNAENVTFIRSPGLAADYLRYWNARRQLSHPFKAPVCPKG